MSVHKEICMRVPSTYHTGHCVFRASVPPPALYAHPTLWPTPPTAPPLSHCAHPPHSASPSPPPALNQTPPLNPTPLPFQSSPEARLYHRYKSQQEAGDEQHKCEGDGHTNGVSQQ